ncbi:MAG: hypothetical protein KAJ35_07960 [Thermoplasmata archaeon]|nr:hypothetical protein [Thermoplasmata archaeon]
MVEALWWVVPFLFLVAICFTLDLNHLLKEKETPVLVSGVEGGAGGDFQVGFAEGMFWVFSEA